MKREVKRYLKYITIALLAVQLSGCALERRNHGPAKPRYADYEGTGFSVQCDRLRVQVAALEHFYFRDGTLKTREQVCKEFNPGSRIRRGS